MGWLIVIFLLLRSKSPAPSAAGIQDVPYTAPRFQNFIPIPPAQGSVPLGAPETHIVQNPNVTNFGMGVLEVPLSSSTVLNLPYQYRDPKLPASSRIGTSILAQEALLNPGGGFAFSLDATKGFE